MEKTRNIPQVSKIENFNHKNIVIFGHNTINNQDIVFDLWNKYENDYKQILIQINKLKLIKSDDINKVIFDVSDRDNILEQISNIETYSLDIMQQYIKLQNKKITYTDRVLCPEKNQLKLNIHNLDYDPIVYDRNKNVATFDYIYSDTSSFNIIFEVIAIVYNPVKGTLELDMRLRLMMENKLNKQLIRQKIIDITNFIQDSEQSDSIHDSVINDEYEQDMYDYNIRDTNDGDVQDTDINNDNNNSDTSDDNHNSDGDSDDVINSIKKHYVS
jgi:hypothetical protein